MISPSSPSSRRCLAVSHRKQMVRHLCGVQVHDRKKAENLSNHKVSARRVRAKGLHRSSPGTAVSSTRDATVSSLRVSRRCSISWCRTSRTTSIQSNVRRALAHETASMCGHLHDSATAPMRWSPTLHDAYCIIHMYIHTQGWHPVPTRLLCRCGAVVHRQESR